MSFEADLKIGIKVGKVTHKKMLLRDATALDIIEASVDSERVVAVPNGVNNKGAESFSAELLCSPTLVGAHTLRRQIVSIGPLDGPFEYSQLNLIKPIDLNIIQQKIEERENLALEAVAQRGRSDEGGSDDGDVD